MDGQIHSSVVVLSISVNCEREKMLCVDQPQANSKVFKQNSHF